MVKRLRVFLLASVLIGLGGVARDVRAGATVDLLFVAKNGSPIVPTDTIVAVPGDLLDMAVIMTNDVSLTGLGLSLNYDLDGDDELDIAFAILWRGVSLGKAFFRPPGPRAPTITPTFVGSFVGFSTDLVTPVTLPPAAGAYAGGYQMGTVTWKVNAGVNSDGVDVVSGLFNVGVDGFADGTFQLIDSSVLFRGATVNVPEPATGCLLGIALVGLALVRRRRRPESGRASGSS